MTDEIERVKPKALEGAVVPDLGGEMLPREADGETYERESVANAHTLYFIAEHDRPEGVSMQEVAREFGLSAFQLGGLAISMKDAVELGYAEIVSPRGDQYAWRVTDKGLVKLGLQARVEAPPVPAAVLSADAREMYAQADEKRALGKQREIER